MWHTWSPPRINFCRWIRKERTNGGSVLWINSFDANGIGIDIRAQHAWALETYIRIRISRAAGPGILTCEKKTLSKIRN